MKKFFICLLSLLLSTTFLFSENLGKLIDKIDGKHFSIHYEIFLEDNGKALLLMTEDGPAHTQFKGFYDNKEDIYKVIEEMEDALELQYNKVKSEFSDDWKIFYDHMNSNSISFLCDTLHFFPEKKFFQNMETGEHYYYVDYRKEKEEIVTIRMLDFINPNNSYIREQNNFVYQQYVDNNENVRLEIQSRSGGDFFDLANEYARSNAMPDIFYMFPSGPSNYVHDKKVARDLIPILKEEGIYSDYYECVLDPSMQSSYILSELPQNLMVTSCVYVNTKVLKECGLEPAKSYDELKKQLKVLKKNGKELILMGNDTSWVMQSCLFSMIMGRYAGSNWANEILSGKMKCTDKPFKKAVEMVKKMYKDGVISKKSLTSSYQDITVSFAKEEGAYLIDGDWRSGAFVSDNNGYALISPYEQDKNIKIIPFPSLPGEVYSNTCSGVVGSGYGISNTIVRGSLKERECIKLLKWLSGKEVQQFKFDNGISTPSLKNGISYEKCEPIFKKRDEFYKSITKLTPVFDSYFPSNVSEVLNEMLYRLGKGEVDVNEVCKKVQKAIDEQ